MAELVEKTQFTYKKNNTNIKIHLDIQDEFVGMDTALPLGLIINELLTNSFKYAYPTTQIPQLRLTLNKKMLHYADNGPGLPNAANPVKFTSFGIYLIQSLSKQIATKNRFYNDNGLNFELIF